MTKEEKEKVINTYFDMWVKQDFSELESVFTEDIYYSECYGPEYYGLSEIGLWIDAMLQKQTVLEWNIKGFIHENNTVVVEWYFKEQQGSKIHSFDGVSIVKFVSDGRISTIKEFESKSDHIAPYH